MSPKIVVVGLMLFAMAACAPMPKPATPSIPPAPGPQAEAGAAPSDAKPSADAGKPADLAEPDMQAMPPTDVRMLKCSVINVAGDDDKAYASTFLLGYRSALAHMHVIDTKRIDSILQAAVAECATKPDALAYKVFADAEIKVYAADGTAHKLLHHKKLATTPAAASPEAPAPAAPAAQPGATPEPPPMRYAPAEGAPPPAEPSNPPPQASSSEKPPVPAKSDDKPAAETAPPATPPAENSPK
jgi:hypothetical protein